MQDSLMRVEVERTEASATRCESDLLAVEEPLEIRVGWRMDGAPRRATISVTMRTPGDDAELAAGFLFTEGIVRERSQIESVQHCGPAAGDAPHNLIRVDLTDGVSLDVARLARFSFTSSSCGVCGKTSLDALQHTACAAPLGAGPTIDAETVHTLPGAVREAQAIFASTGGLHASALFDRDGRLVLLREDVGRHNALDKVIGAELLAGRLPASERVLLVSGRVSFELVQKAVVAGIPILAAVGAPSSLAVQLARRAGMTLLGFVRDGRFNIYSGAERVART